MEFLVASPHQAFLSLYCWLFARFILARWVSAARGLYLGLSGLTTNTDVRSGAYSKGIPVYLVLADLNENPLDTVVLPEVLFTAKFSWYTLSTCSV